jgi:DNA polymerase III, gamma/tau subunits
MNSPKINDLFINSRSREYLKSYLKSPTHTLLLSGPVGVGLGSIAKVLAYEIATNNVILIEPTLHAQQKTANINVSDIKSVKKLLSNKRRSALAVVIDEVDKMTASTPETLLKLLEEPVDNVYFILTTHNMFNMPATVVSRSQVLNMLPVENTEGLVKSIKPSLKQNQVKFMADGLPAEIIRLDNNEEYFRGKARLFEDVKKFINFSTYDRLVVVSKFKNRNEAIEFVGALAKIYAMSATKSGKTDNLTLMSDVIERLSKNGNIKAQMTYLAVNF